ncbi:MAG: DUF4339 domain-containing protein [Planctomycetes bacterium]|nr:DUF4339 domain-containing protein [Planctomycetota bacterium]
MTIEHEWHYVRDGNSVGPTSKSELMQLVATGELRSHDLVWRDGMPEWAPVSSLNLTPAVPVQPPLPPPPPGPHRREVRTRRSRPPTNPHLIVWPSVGVAALLLCIGWTLISQRPSTRTAEHTPASTAHPAKRTVVNQGDEASELDTPTPRPLEKAVGPTLTVPSEKPPADLVPAVPAETQTPKPEIVTNSPEVPISQPPQPTIEQSPVSIPTEQTLYQGVEIRRNPTFSIQGLETKQSLHYRVLSNLKLEHDAESRTTKVIQFVDNTQLVSADDASRKSFAKALENLKRQQYTYRLNHRGEVIEFTGHKKNLATVSRDLLSSSGFQLTSVIDEDGWKELAELTFVTPPDGQEATASWNRQMTHDWGALGRWSGITTFRPQLPTDQLMQVTFTRSMKYTGPDAGTGGTLPFKISRASFEVQDASGSIIFDVDQRRVQRATEHFDVRGTVTAELAGAGVQIDLTEQQRIEITLSNQRLTLQ